MLKKEFKTLIKLSFCIIMIISLPLHSFAAKKVYGPNLRELDKYRKIEYHQFEAHPKNCFFGNNEDCGAIKSVEVKGDKSNYIALTFDSSWNNTQTYELLDLLDEHDVKSTFFLTSIFIKDNPEQVKEIAARGHEIGNHTDTHTSFKKYKIENDRDKMVSEIAECHKLIKDLLGIDMCLFRFPYGHYTAESIGIVKELGYYPIQWTADSFDWKNVSALEILKNLRAEKAYKAGNIVLFHNGALYTVEALRSALLNFKKAGLKCVKVSDLIYTENFYLGKNFRQIENK